MDSRPEAWLNTAALSIHCHWLTRQPDKDNNDGADLCGGGRHITARADHNNARPVLGQQRPWESLFRVAGALASSAPIFRRAIGSSSCEMLWPSENNDGADEHCEPLSHWRQTLAHWPQIGRVRAIASLNSGTLPLHAFVLWPFVG